MGEYHIRCEQATGPDQAVGLALVGPLRAPRRCGAVPTPRQAHMIHSAARADTRFGGGACLAQRILVFETDPNFLRELETGFGRYGAEDEVIHDPDAGLDRA